MLADRVGEPFSVSFHGSVDDGSVSENEISCTRASCLEEGFVVVELLRKEESQAVCCPANVSLALVLLIEVIVLVADANIICPGGPPQKHVVSNIKTHRMWKLTKVRIGTRYDSPRRVT